jgi:NADH-quinone oxidoreductase subunit N
MSYFNALLASSDIFYWVNETYLIVSSFFYIIYTNTIISRNSNISVVSLHQGYTALIVFIIAYVCLIGIDITAIHTISFFNAFSNKSYLSNYIGIFFFLVFVVYFVYTQIEQKKYKISSIEYIFIYLSIIYSCCFLLYAQDLLTMYLAIEIITISSYILILIQKYSVSLIELGIKYFIWNSIISVIFLYFIHNVYNTYSTIDIRTLSILTSLPNYENVQYEITNFFFLLLLLFFKLGLVPFHFWMLEIYEGVLDKNTLFFLIFPKIIFFVFFIKNISIFIETINIYWKTIGLLNVFFASIYLAILLLKKNKLKSSIIYISLLSSGFLYLDLITLSTEGILSVYFYLIIYCIHIFLFFFIKQSIILTNKKEHTFNIYILNRLYTTQPYITISLLVMLFSLLGIPPFIGFFSKLYLLYGLFIQNNYYILYLVLVSSLLSAFFYLYLIKNMYINNLKSYVSLLTINQISSYFISLFTCYVMFFFVHSNSIFSFLYYILSCYHF